MRGKFDTKIHNNALMLQRLLKTILYQGFRSLFGIICVAYLRCRWFDGGRVPDSGPTILVANHQSHVDPVLVGVGCRRRLSFFARNSLFVGPFGKLIQLLDAIPVARGGSSASGVKETLRRLKRGEAVMIFPEGTRTSDGRIAPMQAGFCRLARRSGATIVPIGIDGAFQAWPRTQKFPHPGRVTVQFGDPIGPEAIEQLDEPTLMELIRRRIEECHARAKER